MVVTKQMTIEEFAALPDDGWRHELIRGELHRMPAGGLQHGNIGLIIASSLRGIALPRNLGVAFVETDFRFPGDPPTVRIPDVAFIRTNRLPPSEEWPLFSRVLPDLAIEVVSPNDEPAEIAEKVNFCLAHGIPLVWVAYPQSRQVVVHRPGVPSHTLGFGETLDGEEIVPGFQLPLADIFR